MPGEHHAGRPLVGRGHQHGPGRGAIKRGDVEPVRVDRDGHRGHPGGDRLFGRRDAGPRVLEGQRVHAVAGQHAQDEPERLGHAGADDDLVGGRRHRPHPPQVGGQHLAQPRLADRVTVVEGGVRGGAADLPDRPRPVLARREAKVGDAVPEVGDRVTGPGRPARRRRRSRADDRARRHARGRPGPAGQVALGLQLRVAVLDQAPRQPQGAGELARGRQPLAAGQTTTADRVAHLVFELRAEPGAAVPVDRDE